MRNRLIVASSWLLLSLAMGYSTVRKGGFVWLAVGVVAFVVIMVPLVWYQVRKIQRRQRDVAK